MNRADAFVAVTRYGLGARPGELAHVAGDPRGWLYEQLRPAPLPAPLGGMRPSHEVIVERLLLGRSRDRKRLRALREAHGAIFRAEVAARTRAQVESAQPLRERLVAFWSNHFTVSVSKPQLTGVVGAFEREAIRPHVTGRFRDLLGAVVAHPVMLLYLDNESSFGPRSYSGRKEKRGLNENLAREVLELHTLGVDGGYDQRDVQALAKMLTGWAVANVQVPEAGRFAYFERRHEPGPKTMLGVTYRETGWTEVARALDALARHPSTARHLATKLARHFVADDPPPETVSRLAGVYLETGGDLGAMTRALIDLPEPWASPLRKLKMPWELAVSAMRALAWQGDDATVNELLKLLGQYPFTANSPAGWPDTAAHWLGPQTLMQRLDWAQEMGRRMAGKVDPRRLAARTIGPVADPDTLAAIERAPSAAEAIALLLASPEFQRR